MKQRDCGVVGRRCFVTGVLAATVVVVSRQAGAVPRSLVELGRRFQALRRRLASTKPGELDEALEGFEGELHTIMTELGDRLGVAGTKSGRVTAIMGQPDARREGQWIYLWRGWHDYLYFEVAKGCVVSADWYMAGE